MTTESPTDNPFIATEFIPADKRREWHSELSLLSELDMDPGLDDNDAMHQALRLILKEMLSKTGKDRVITLYKNSPGLRCEADIGDLVQCYKFQHATGEPIAQYFFADPRFVESRIVTPAIIREKMKLVTAGQAEDVIVIPSQESLSKRVLRAATEYEVKAGISPEIIEAFKAKIKSYFGDMTSGEIAKATGVSLPAVSQLTSPISKATLYKKGLLSENTEAKFVRYFQGIPKTPAEIKEFRDVFTKLRELNGCKGNARGRSSRIASLSD